MNAAATDTERCKELCKNVETTEQNWDNKIASYKNAGDYVNERLEQYDLECGNKSYLWHLARSVVLGDSKCRNLNNEVNELKQSKLKADKEHQDASYLAEKAKQELKSRCPTLREIRMCVAMRRRGNIGRKYATFTLE
jgi:hypothetical protein